MDTKHRDELVVRIHTQPSIAAKELREIAATSPELFLDIAKYYFLKADPYDDVSVGLSLLRTALQYGKHDELTAWVAKQWETLGTNGRISFVNAAIDPEKTISTELLVDLFRRDSTSDAERFRIFTGVYGTQRERRCTAQINEMINALLRSSDAEIVRRTRDIAIRYRGLDPNGL